MAARPNPSSLGAEFENSSPRCSPSVRNRCVGKHIVWKGAYYARMTNNRNFCFGNRTNRGSNEYSDTFLLNSE